MFRKMRRSRQELSREESIDVLERGTHGVLALMGDDGYPYALPISYAYKDGRIYFHSAAEGHKIDSIRRCGKASFTVVDLDEVKPEEYTTVYRSVVSSENQNLSKILFTFGAQYAFKVGQGNALILGVTYQPKTTASIKQTRLTLSYNTTVSDTVYSGSSRWDMDIPAKLAAGVSFQTNKLTVAFDYSRQNWKGAFEIPKDQDITLGLQQDFRLGASYTPNRYDIRNALNRWTYKAGVRYSTSYLSKAGHQLSDAAVSIGVDFGLKKGTFSKVGIGVEYGERGSRAAGQVRERYFNIVAALSLFGKDYWFVRPKYN